MQSHTDAFARLFPALPDILSLPSAEARMVLALRFTISARDQGVDPRRALAERLKNVQAVTRFRILVESVGQAWPEAFQVGRCCCPCTTPDEILLVNMMRSAARQDRPVFDHLLCEMIDDPARDRIYTDM